MSYDLINEMNYRLKQLDTSTGMLKQAGVKKANTEALYRQELAKEILDRRANGMPVTIIADVCRGQPRIAKLKTDRDIADSTYQAIIESINSQKLAIRVLEAQIAREWTSGQGNL